MARLRIGRCPYYVPRTCRELREQLRAMGVTRINRRPLSRIRKVQLLAVFHAMRSNSYSETESPVQSGALKEKLRNDRNPLGQAQSIDGLGKEQRLCPPS